MQFKSISALSLDSRVLDVYSNGYLGNSILTRSIFTLLAVEIWDLGFRFKLYCFELVLSKVDLGSIESGES